MNLPFGLDPSRWRADIVDAARNGLIAGAAISVVAIPLLWPWLRPGVDAPPGQAPADAAMDTAVRSADFGGEAPSDDARQVADWIAGSRDNAGQPFVIIDKKAARLYVFDARARLRDASRVLLGAAVGDDSVPGIGERPIEQVRPEERTTPAGRFDARAGRNALGEDVIWVDYAAAVSMHRVRVTDPKERRLERLASSRVADKRISYGCINVPARFYDRQLKPLFAGRGAPVYVLPEVKTVQQVFGLQGADALHKS
jgi:hypothetical protein